MSKKAAAATEAAATEAAAAEQAPAQRPPVRVRLDPTKRPGLKACGQYQVGQVYTVPADEAEHLIAHKGFTRVQE